MCWHNWSKLVRIIGVTVVLLGAGTARAEQVNGYGFEAAAQEISQLFWLADTASACGWASDDDALRFKHFSVRFLTAHLSDANRVALVSLVTEKNYEAQIRRVAREDAPHNCDSSRWRMGWASFKAAADERDHDF